MLAGVATGLAGCRGTDSPTDGDTPAGDANPTPPPQAESVWYTHAQPSGNRRVAGAGDIENTDPVTFRPDGEPRWLVARPGDSGSHWTVMTAEGRVTDWHVADGTATRQQEFGTIPKGSQPVVTGEGESATLLTPPNNLAARSSPLVLRGTDRQSSRLLYVADSGDLVIVGSETTTLPVGAPSDSRLVALGDGRVALFGGTTDRYRHGALGDSIEPETLYVVDATTAEIAAEYTLGPPAVFESLQPLVADLDGDGTPEIITTVANSSDGAQIAVFSADGERIATGPRYGPGWRHQLAVAGFGPDGGTELAVVRKPHVARVVEFYRLSGGTLEITATVGGVSTHTYGSRILDGALAGRFDGEVTTLLAPTTERDELVSVRREQGDANIEWRLSLDGRLVSNITGVTGLDSSIAVGGATTETVHVWQE